MTHPHHPIFPEILEPDETGLVAIGANLSPTILIEAYSRGIFPWSGEHPIPWYSPDPRLVLFPENFHTSRSLRKLLGKQRFEISYDRDFREVMKACARMPRRDQSGTWITGGMFASYGALHDLGIAHSVEVREAGRLVGGIYGLALGAAFFGESMFSRVPNASKVALHDLCRYLSTHGYHFLDCQQITDHLLSLGATVMARQEFLERLRKALREPIPTGRWSRATNAGRGE